MSRTAIIVFLCMYPHLIQSTSVLNQTTKLVPSDNAPGDSFGRAVSIDANTLIIGAPNDYTVSKTGSAYIYVGNGMNQAWVFQQKLTASDGADNDLFGRAVSISGDTVVVGARGHTTSAGAAYIFVRNSTGV